VLFRSALIESGDTDAAEARLRSLEERVADEPWLAAKVRLMREMADRDAAMASKEMLYSSQRMSMRLSTAMEADYTGDETDKAGPAYLRRKPGEGKGRKRG
jgi:thioredoxin-like negative regulator of GroEL